VCEQHVTDGFGIRIYAFNACHKIPAIALQEDAVFSPVVVLKVSVPCALEFLIRLGVRIEDEAIRSEYTALLLE
jgi:hypothetical protein